MSKIGKQQVSLDENIKVIRLSDSEYKIEGPLGSLHFEIPGYFRLESDNNFLRIIPINNLDKKSKSLWGTVVSILKNKIKGVSEGFTKTLILEGLGYSAEVKDKKIIFKIGFSHLVEMDIPDDLSVTIRQEKNRNFIEIKGIDKERVGNFASKIKSLKPADRYHAKGFRYINETIKLKPVKKAGK